MSDTTVTPTPAPTLEARVLAMWEESEHELANLQNKALDDPDTDPHLWLDLILESARNSTLRCLLNTPQDAHCKGVGG